MKFAQVLCLLFLLAACGSEDADKPENPGSLEDPENNEDVVDDDLDPEEICNSRTLTSPYATRVVSFTPGIGAGYGQESMPDVVLGAPLGGGEVEGSLDVVSLGEGGEIILEMGQDILDCEGPDLAVFENPFLVGSGSTYYELGEVSVSLDGETWHVFPCAIEGDAQGQGCAGVNLVFADPGKGISPQDSSVSGGDLFDLKDLGIAKARFVRIRDQAIFFSFSAPPSRGFDLDGVSVLMPGEEP